MTFKGVLRLFWYHPQQQLRCRSARAPRPIVASGHQDRLKDAPHKVGFDHPRPLKGCKNAPTKLTCTLLAPKEPKGFAIGFGSLSLRCSFGSAPKHLLLCPGILQSGITLAFIRWADVSCCSAAYLPLHS